MYVFVRLCTSTVYRNIFLIYVELTSTFFYSIEVWSITITEFKIRKKIFLKCGLPDFSKDLFVHSFSVLRIYLRTYNLIYELFDKTLYKVYRQPWNPEPLKTVRSKEFEVVVNVSSFLNKQEYFITNNIAFLFFCSANIILW